ncbi:MAG: DUF4129 domain-containing transglutaminase family protein [Armatimonadota bacterium]
MFSPAGARERYDPDEGALYLATAAALAASLLAAGWASGSARVGAVGGALAMLGVWTGWRAREWAAGRRIALGVLGAVLAGGSAQALISWEIANEVGSIYMAQGDIGLSLGLRMGVLLVAFSFLLIYREMLPFALVPAVTLFGLAGGRGDSSVAFGCFLVFLPAALAALGQAMMLSGVRPADREARVDSGEATGQPPVSAPQSPMPVSSWRSRHWSLLGSLIAAIIGLGALLYLPVYAYGTQYYWPLAMMSLPTGRFGFLEGRMPQSQSSRSYSVGQGPITPGESVVFSYAGEPVQRWRGEVFDNFTGNAWTSTDDEPVPLTMIRGEINIAELFPPTSEAALVTHELRAETDLPLVVYGAGQIQRALLPRRLGPLLAIGAAPQPARPGAGSSGADRPTQLAGVGVEASGSRQRPNAPDPRPETRDPRTVASGLRVDRFGCVAAPGATLRAGTHYTVVSDPHAYDQGPGGRRPGTGERPLLGPGPQPLGPPLDPSYRAIPLSSRRVADLARTITAGAASDEQKVAALTSYLQRECVYTLSAPAVPRGEDAADFFLFKSKRGYCDLFATAFAVMARSVGIPSRFVTGWAGGGQFDPTHNRYLVHESDGHAWVEVWVQGSGFRGQGPGNGRSPTLAPGPSTLAPAAWLTVDPTPGGGPVTLSLPQRLAASLQTFLRSHPFLQIGIWAMVALALLGGGMVATRHRRLKRELSLDHNDPRTVVLLAWMRLTRLLARRGLPRHPSQTPLEYLEAVGARVQGSGFRAPAPSVRQELAPALAPLHSLTGLFLLARYSPQPVTAETARQALSHLHDGLQSLRGRARGG